MDPPDGQTVGFGRHVKLGFSWRTFIVDFLDINCLDVDRNYKTIIGNLVREKPEHVAIEEIRIRSRPISLKLRVSGVIIDSIKADRARLGNWFGRRKSFGKPI